MKGLIALLLFLVLLAAIGSYFIVSKTGPENAPDEIVIIELEDNFEK